jgi:quercetin dioxygenase-like cupin family protein
VRERFIAFGAGDHLRDQNRHPAMHQTETLDVICLIQGEASLVLDKVETRLKPGNIVIQRGTSHGWTAHGGPALFLAVLIDRPLAK